MAQLAVLVTGAAGLIGSELCGALMDRGHRVTALVHRRAHLVRSDGSTVPTGDAAAVGQVGLLRGDVRQADLGLGPDAARLLAKCDLVVHCAAATSLAVDPRHAAVNVAGTQHLLDLMGAARSDLCRPGLVHVSTAYVCGARSNRIEEADGGADGDQVRNAYEASKAEGERRVLASGLPAAIARPSIVVGRWRDGAISRFENIYGLLRLVGSGRIRVLPAAPGATLDLVPIDHVVGGLVDMVERFKAARGRVFHLASGTPVPVKTLSSTAFAGFHAPRVVPIGEAEGHGTARHELLALYAGYLARDPRFVTANLTALSGRVTPAIDAAFLQRMVGYAASAGFLRPDPALLAQAV